LLLVHGEPQKGASGMSVMSGLGRNGV
jgi:hypothetical protein